MAKWIGWFVFAIFLLDIFVFFSLLVSYFVGGEIDASEQPLEVIDYFAESSEIPLEISSYQGYGGDETSLRVFTIQSNSS